MYYVIVIWNFIRKRK